MGKKITIFLGSSIDDLHIERYEIAGFVNSLNNKYHDRGVFIELYTCEETSGAMAIGGSQSKHDKCIEDDADAAFFMFFRKAGEFTMHELELARNTFVANKCRPSVFVFFKTIDNITSQNDEIKNAVDKIANEYAHYYKTFEKSDTVKLEILMCINDLLDGKNDLVIKDGKVLVDNIEIEGINADGIFAYRNNPALKKLKAEIDELKIKMSEALADDRTDDVLDFSAKMNEKKKEYNELEKSVLDLIHQFYEKNRKGEKADPLCLEALRLLECGKVDEAIRILPTAEQNKEEADVILKERQIAEETNRDKAKVIIEHAKIAIKAMIADTAELIEIEEMYDSVYELCRVYDVKMIEDYIEFLCFMIPEWHVYSRKILSGKPIYIPKAIKIAEELKTIYMDPRAPADSQKIEWIDKTLARFYTWSGKYIDAEYIYKKILDANRELEEEDYEKYLSVMISSYEDIALYYKKSGEIKKAEEFYNKALSFSRKRAEENSDCYRYLLSDLDKTMKFYKDIGENEQAERLYDEAITIIRRLADESPDDHLDSLAYYCNDLADFYVQCYSVEEKELTRTEELYKEAVKIRRKLAEKDPEWDLEDLADSCENLAHFYKTNSYKINYDEKYDSAERLYNEAVEIRRKLAEKDPERYSYFYLKLCKELAEFYSSMGLRKYDQALRFYNEAVEISRRFAEEKPYDYLPYLNDCCSELAELYYKKGELKQAEEFYSEAVEACRKLAKNHQIDLYSLNELYNNLASFYCKTNRLELAEKFYNDAIDNCRSVVEENRDKIIKYNSDIDIISNDGNKPKQIKELFYEDPIVRAEKNYINAIEKLKSECKELTKFYKKIDKLDQAEKFCLEPYNLYKELEEKFPGKYLSYIAWSSLNVARFYKDIGKNDKADEFYSEAVSISRSLAEKDPEKGLIWLARFCNYYAEFCKYTDKNEKAEKLYNEEYAVYSKIKKFSQTDLYDLEEFYDDFAGFYRHIGKNEKAEDIYNISLALHRKLAKKHPDRERRLAHFCSRFARFYECTDKNKKAEELYNESLSIDRMLSEKNPIRGSKNLAGSCMIVAGFYKRIDKNEKAEDLYNEALSIYRRLAEHNSEEPLLDLSRALKNIAEFHKEAGHTEQAEKLYLEAFETYLKLSENNSGRFLKLLFDCCDNLSILYSATNRPDEAEKYRRLAEEYKKMSSKKQ